MQNRPLLAPSPDPKANTPEVLQDNRSLRDGRLRKAPMVHFERLLPGLIERALQSVLG